MDGAVDNNANNLANVTPGQGHILAYDHNGNRIEDRSWGTQVTPEYVQNYDESGTALGAPQLVGYQSQTGIQTTWYRYDKMNRLSTVATGAYGQVQTGVQQTGVDESGQPVYQAVYTTEALGQAQAIVLDTRLYDGASRLVQSGPAGSLPAAYVKALTDGNLNLSGATTTVSRYDADGRLLSQAVTNEADPSSSTTTQYTEYDAAGNLEAYQTTQGVNGDTIVTNTTVTFGRYDGYVETLQSSVSTNESSGNQTSGTTTEGYDANGRLISVVDSATSSNSRTLVNDAQGHVLDKNQQGELHELVANGQVIGIYGQTIDSQTPTQADGSPNYDAVGNFDLAYEPVTNSYPAAATGQYPVQAGDTLQSIALAAYGDSSLWYLIADANGLKGNADLKVGQVLNIPTRVGDVHNNAQTYAPYDASRIVGSTAPQLPVPAGNQDSGGGGCGPIGEIIMVVVAVVATIYTAGAASIAFGAAEGAAAAGESTFAIGLDTLGGSFGVEGVAAAAVGGAVGSVASQAVGDAIGARSGFSFGDVALGALGAGVGAGVGEEASALGIGGTGVAGAAERAALGNVIDQGIGVATGLQHSFSWQNVAVAAVSAGAGNEAGQAFGASEFASSLAPTTARAVGAGLSSGVSGLTAAIVSGGRIDAAQIAGDAFGNALGEDLAQQNLALNGNTGGNPFAARTQNQIDVGNEGDAVLFGTMGNAGQAGTSASITTDADWAPLSATFDTNAANNQIVAAFSAAQSDTGSGAGVLMAANDLTQPGQQVVTSDAGGGGGTDPNTLAPIEIRANGPNGSRLYTNGQGFPVSFDTLADGRILTSYADGYSVSAQDGEDSVFTARNMSDIGPTLSNADYQAVLDRASALQWGTDSSSLYHSVAGFFDNLFGIQPNPMRTPDQEAELTDLQGMISARVTTDPLQASNPVLAARLDAAAGGPIGGLAVWATQNSSPTDQYYAARTAGSADGVLTAFGGAYAARGIPGFLGTPSQSLEPVSTSATNSALTPYGTSLGDEMAALQRMGAANNSAEGTIFNSRISLKPYVISGDVDGLISQLDVSSGGKPLGFWSGNLPAAMNEANTSGIALLETTPGGATVNNWQFLSDRLPWNAGGQQFWGGLSEKYAMGASGDISVFQTPERAFDSAGNLTWQGGPTWQGRELPVVQDLQNLGVVNNINYNLVQNPSGYVPGLTRWH